MPNKISTLEEIRDLILSKQNIAVISHLNPDPDAYGSSCGLTLFLQSIGKKAYCVNETGIIERFEKLPGVLNIQKKFSKTEHDLLIVCDCGAKSRVGEELKNCYKDFPHVVNIDHHSSNEMFGDYNIVVEKACSTSEIIFDLIKTFKTHISSEIAQCLLAGIIGDTGFFRYRSVSERTFQLAHDLSVLGANSAVIADTFFANDSVENVKFQSYAISQLELISNKQVAVIIIPAQMFTDFGVNKEAADVLVDRIRDIKGVRIAVVIREVDGIWRVSLRSRNPRDNVALICSKFGGGGHIMAAAFRWKKSLEELKVKLFAELECESSVSLFRGASGSVKN